MEKLLLTNAEALELTGGKLSIVKFYHALLKRNDFPKVYIGERVYIHRQKFIKWWEEELRQMGGKFNDLTYRI